MANVVFRLDAQTGNAVQGFLKVLDAQKKNDEQFKRVTKSASLFDTSLKSIGSRVAAFASLGAVTALVAKGIHSIDTEAKRAAAHIDEMVSPLQKLAQLSANMGDFKGAQELAKKISLATGVSEGQAIQFVSSGQRAGLGEADILEGSRMLPIEPAAGDVLDELADLRDLVGGTLGEIRDVVGTAAQQSGMKGELEAFSKVLLDNARIGKSLGGDSEKLLREIAALASTMTAAGEGGAARLELLLGKFAADDRTFKGLSPMEAANKFLNMSEKRQEKVVDEKREAQLARLQLQEAMANAPRVAAELGHAGGWLAEKEKLMQGDPRMASARAAAKSRNDLQIQSEKFGIQEQQQQALLNSARARNVESGAKGLTRFLVNDLVYGVADLLNVSPRALVGKGMDEAGNKFGDAAGSIQESAKTMERTATLLDRAMVGLLRMTGHGGRAPLPSAHTE